MRKKVELEEEGVIFDPKSGKIAKSCLHSWTSHAGEEASSRKGAKRTCDDGGSQSGAAEEGALGQARSKRRKQRSIASFFGQNPDSGSGGAPTTKGGAEEGIGAARDDDAAMHQSLRGGILALLRKRAPEKTC
jgi:hypothetical protein